jgi:hypothetical protein
MPTPHAVVLVAGAVVAAGLVALAAPAQALSSQQCGAKYQAAKTAGTLNGQSWNDFRKAQCAADAAPGPAAEPAAKTSDSETKTTEAKPAATKRAAKPAAAPAPTGNAVFPSAVDPKYAKETAARARIHTCSDQWKANKAGNGNGGLRWIQKGGGYWSECNKRLKGAAAT